jgi:hypothetical protein
MEQSGPVSPYPADSPESVLRDKSRAHSRNSAKRIVRVVAGMLRVGDSLRKIGRVVVLVLYARSSKIWNREPAQSARSAPLARSIVNSIPIVDRASFRPLFDSGPWESDQL